MSSEPYWRIRATAADILNRVYHAESEARQAAQANGFQVLEHVDADDTVTRLDQREETVSEREAGGTESTGDLPSRTRSGFQSRHGG